jgi:hypothetical protein
LWASLYDDGLMIDGSWSWWSLGSSVPPGKCRKFVAIPKRYMNERRFAVYDVPYGTRLTAERLFGRRLKVDRYARTSNSSRRTDCTECAVLRSWGTSHGLVTGWKGRRIVGGTKAHYLGYCMACGLSGSESSLPKPNKKCAPHTDDDLFLLYTET